MIPKQYEGIKLLEAIAKPIIPEPLCRFWCTSGHYVEDKDIPQNTTTPKTLVIQADAKCFLLAISGKDDKKDFFFKIIAKFSSLEELQNKFPHLVDVDGNLGIWG